MKVIQNIGLGMFIVALLIFTAMLGIGHQELTPQNINIENQYHKEVILEAAEDAGLLNTKIGGIAFISKIKSAMKTAAKELDTRAVVSLPAGVDDWDYKLQGWQIRDYANALVTNTAGGPVQENPWLFFLMTFGLAILGGLLFIIPKFSQPAGIKNNGIYHNALTRGLKWNMKMVYLIPIIIGIILWGFFKTGNAFWPIVTVILALVISYFVFYIERSKENTPQRDSSPVNTGWLGVIAGTYLIGFYILLYWAPAYINNWIDMVSPISKMLSGNAASNWFLYGLMYCVIVIVMGIRMMSKYQHNKYQRIRTMSVMFFQTSFAFLIPEILVRFNQPWFDFKNIWPLHYDFFFKYNLDNLISSGGLGIFMLVWGILLIVIGVPFITYFFGKRWYCSWVCGCGGLAETMGDPFRQLSDKSLRAWKYERYIIHGVLAAAIIMTGFVLVNYFTGKEQLLGIQTEGIRSWYGFLIGAGFSGVVGTGFYPLMGNRMWCRFGCPLAAYLGLVQRFKSRFRITTNGGQCISCGNCSTYCEMGIDVRSYAQKGQDIVRSSCVGCGVCSAVCPRGVLRLENASGDIAARTIPERAIHITEDQVRLLN